MEIKEIRQAVDNGEITAISIDTCIIEGKGYHFESGLLKKVRQFKNSPVQFIFAEVVYREVIAHLQDKEDRVVKGLDSALNNIGHLWNIDKADKARIRKLARIPIKSGDWAKNQVDKYLSETGGMYIKAANISVHKLIESYFSCSPPFASGKDKKHEFPDAFALFSLEAWAEENKTKVLLVSGDKGWRDFASKSEYLLCLDNLADGLSCFQNEEGVYLLDEFVRDSNGVILMEIEREIREKVDSIFDIQITADSVFEYDYEVDQVEVDTVEFEKPANLGVEVVEYDQEHDILAATVTVDVDLVIGAHFQFFIWDSLDKEYIPFGSRSYSSTWSGPIEALLTICGIQSKNPEIDNVEIEASEVNVFFDSVEPNLGDKRDDYDWV
ncbi:MAG: DUF4935 domain-containing protein [Candidatus Cloacimonetes bacterium]|nr:DUF4935 domain-containing protein [Candidatus Cloacimonadota bacterium]